MPPARMRWLGPIVAGLVALPLVSVPSGAAETGGSPEPESVATRGDDLRRLRTQADGALLVGRDTADEVRLLGSRAGRPLATPHTPRDAPPRVAARDYLRRFGGALGLDARAAVTADVVLPSDAGETVRFQQSIDGVPVLGGEVVVGLDASDRLTSLGGETTPAGSAGPRPEVTAEAAARTAVAVVGRAHDADNRALDVSSPQLWLYDPSLFGVSDPLGVRPVWRVEISDGLAVRDLVLVDAATGRVVVRMDQINGLDRVVCDLANVPIGAESLEPDCRTGGYVRTETGPVSPDSETEAAFDHAGATADLFGDVAGIDLTALVGYDAGDGTKLRSTVHVCVDRCPWPNAFWNGRGMYYGEGYAAADDVVGHELTHGVIDRTAGLFYWYQSGAINESFADVFGEIADLRYGDDAGDPAWTVGEDTPDGAFRDMARPEAGGQPDRMTSGDYATDTQLWDSGGVHSNSGVGNKAAYLIAEGGTFNGYTVRGLDAGVQHKPKTAAIYWEALQLLTSASDYLDLSLVLPQACRDLAAQGTAGIVGADCVQVDNAVAATEMHLQPVSADAAAPEAEQCPAPSFVTTTFDHDFEHVTDVWTSTGAAMWMGSPNSYLPAYATSGQHSMFGWDPDPELYAEPSDTWLRRDGVTVPTDGTAYLRFNHAYVFERHDDGSLGRRYVDGGRLEYTTDGTWRNAAHLPWVNGPQQDLTFGRATETDRGFGGDSHGYISSRVDLSPLAGEYVQLRWRITGDQRVSSGLGWWLDDIHLYTCRTHAPGAPEYVSVNSGRDMVEVEWQPPVWPGTGVTGYRVTARPGNQIVTLPAGARSALLRGFKPGVDYVVSVSAVNADGQIGQPAVHEVAGTRLTIAATRTVTFGPTRILGRLTENDGTHLPGNEVRLYSQPATGGPWRYVASVAGEIRGHSFDVRPARHTRYQLRFPGVGDRLGSTSPALLVRVRPLLTANLSTTSTRIGSRPTLYGQVLPALVGERVLLQQQIGTRWRTIRSRKLISGSYRFPLPTSARGTFRYRGHLPRTAQHPAAVSPTKQIRVR